MKYFPPGDNVTELRHAHGLTMGHTEMGGEDGRQGGHQSAKARLSMVSDCHSVN